MKPELSRHDRYILRNFRKKYSVKKGQYRYIKSLCHIAFLKAKKKPIDEIYSVPISDLLYKLQPLLIKRALNSGRKLRQQLFGKLICIGLHICDQYHPHFPVFVYKMIRLGYHEVVIKLCQQRPLLVALHHFATWGIGFNKWQLAHYSAKNQPSLICFYIEEALQRNSWVALRALVQKNKIPLQCHNRIQHHYNHGRYSANMFMWYLVNVKHQSSQVGTTS